MKLLVTRADPAGNITLLVETPVEKAACAETARRLMALPELGGEQVGFLVPPRHGGEARLEMMGGEFCGNAARSLGLLVLRGQAARRVFVELSGCGERLAVDADPAAGLASAEMPLPLERETVRLLGRPCSAVLLPGIVHLLWEGAPLEQDEARRLLPEAAAHYRAPAAGLMLLDGDRLTPAVYVAGTDSLCWERSCASGSAAAAWHLAAGGEGERRFAFREPGGVIEAAVRSEGGVCRSLRIGGPVFLGEPQEIEL